VYPACLIGKFRPSVAYYCHESPLGGIPILSQEGESMNSISEASFKEPSGFSAGVSVMLSAVHIDG
jgi:hypothetical protein